MRASTITINHSSHIGFKGFMNIYKKYSFLLIDTTLDSDNYLHFTCSLLERR